MRDRLRALRDAASRAAVPLTLHLELTHRCNARCVHCLQDRDAAPPELDAEAWCAVLDRARAAGTLFVTLSGGEPLLSPHVWRVAEHARRLGMAFRLLTNGIGLDGPTVRRLAALLPLSVEVSVFSPAPARHDAVTRVPGSLARALTGLVRLRRAGVPIGLRCPLLAGSAGDHEALRALATRLGASLAFDPQIFTATDGRAGPTSCRAEDSALAALFAREGPGARGVAPPAPRDVAPCGVARSLLVVGPTGDVLPCVAMPLPAGNVRDAPLDVIWRESPLLQRLRARRWGELSGCAGCPRSGYCGRCSALALLEDGDLDGPSSRACHLAALREQAWGLPPPAGAPAPPRPRALRVLPG